MKTLALLCAGVVAGATVTSAAALPSDWKYVQQLEVPSPGLVKLSLPAETIAAARPGLEDLRLFDSAGREVPLLLERPVAVGPVVRPARRFDVALAAEATVITIATGFTQPIDAVTLETAAAGFIKAVQLEGSPNGTDWSILAKGQPVFRQPYGANQLRLPIPAAPWPFLRLTIDDHRSEPVAFTGALIQAAREPAPAEPVPVTIAERSESDSQTRLTLNLGAAHLTLASLRIDSPDSLFTRAITVAVREVTENGITERPLAGGTIYRVAVAGQAVAAELSLPLDVQIPTREVLLLIDNHDNPPLTITAVAAQRRPVYATFLARQAGAYQVLTGNARCRAPRYDLAALGARLKGGATSSLALTALAANPAWRPPETLPEVHELGTALNLAEWKYRKPIQLGAPGVQRLDLDLELLSHADPRFRDLRLVREDKQYPYVLEHTSLTRKLTPQFEPANDPKRPTVSRWLIRLPQPALPIVRLVCTSRTALFKRQVMLDEEPPDDRGEKFHRLLAETTWVRTPATPATTLTLMLATAPATDRVILETDNGDNPPIELDNFQVYYPVTRLLFKASTGAATYLYYGNRTVDFPHYDLDLVASQLLAADTSPATLAAAEQLQKSSWAESLSVSPTRSVIFWAALALVVVVLLLVISRLLPKAPPPAP